MMTVFLPMLAVFAALSPLLTLAWLWQVKEWRWDRLLEHLRREGWAGQLWGRIRPVIVALYAGAFLLLRENPLIILVFLGCLLLTSTLTAIQIVFGRQRYPVFTKKAVILTVTAGLLTVVAALMIERMQWDGFFPVIVLIQPFTLALAWLLWFPVDTFLKNRIISHARSLREKFPELTVIGVTGSVGKTTTKELLACVLKDLNPAVTPAYVNAEIGVARWLMNSLSQRKQPPEPAPEPEPVIVEMGAYRKGEISILCSFTKPTIGVVTHVGTQHIALFGSQEKLFEAKGELIQSLPSDGRAFLNGDNALARKMATISPCPAVIVGTGGSCDLEAFDIEETPGGIRFRTRDILFEIPLHGTHNVTNILLAIAVGEHLGIKLERMRDLLKSFTPLSQTFSVRSESGVRILDDTHNSSTASMKAAIAWARTQPEEHKILLAAGLIEMGDLQSPAERELGGLAATVFERTIVTDEQSAKNFAAGGAKNVETFSSKSAKIPAGALLVCTGRMAGSVIRRLLPTPADRPDVPPTNHCPNVTDVPGVTV